MAEPVAEPTPPAPPYEATRLDLLWAFIVWGVSGGFLLLLEYSFRLLLLLSGRGIPDVQLTQGAVILSLAVTFIMQVAGFVAAWLVVTRLGRRPFWRTLGWGWTPQFKLGHAVVLGFLMIGVAILSERILPHQETDLEKVLKMGLAARVVVAALAVMTAPFIEEIVYRGVIFSTIEGLMGKAAAVIFVTLLFALVHVPQYWGSVATIAAILSLSFVLTLLRAWTGKLLPCVVTHLVFNGIQAVVLLLAPQQALNTQSNQAAITLIWRILGLGE
ncbi:MAG TPA: CPBP family intramembrane glutamic endopeptidase [Blastocatellia bacterium]|nr:CPBP family intramembrane glutamic endopeptidase [Blastocatellia bacterium]